MAVMTEDPRLEGSVRELARQFRYPRTPDLRAAVLERIERHPRLFGLPVLARTAAAVVLLGVILVATIPEARAAVRAVFRIGVVNLLFDGNQYDQLAAEQSPAGLAGIESLAGETTIDQARVLAPFAIQLPGYPEDLGQPDRVFFQEALGPMVVLVWLEEDGSKEPLMSLHILGDDIAVLKLEPQILAQTTVGGSPAAWTQGPYLLATDDGKIAPARLVEGRVLIWTRGDETYRLESELPLEEARRLAESTY